VSSAGSGKTSCIMGKVKYLTEVKHVDPRRILLISYTNKAATELTTRLATPGLRGYTFHKLALDIISQQTGTKPSVCDQTDRLFLNIYQELSKNEAFQKEIVNYFCLDLNEEDWEKKKRERREKLQDIKAKTIRATFPDMDGNAVMVRSNDEKLLCYFLTSLGVKFRYEEPYEHRVDDELHSQYKPDFSIYYEKDGKQHRVYLEHFGIDEHGMVPLWFAKDKGISYEEANQKYGDGIEWKKSVHEKYGTKFIYTKSAEIFASLSDNYVKFRQALKDRLIQAGVPVHELTSQELYYMVVPKNSAQEKTFIRSIISFITLMKCNNKNINEVMNNVREEHDKANLNIIHGVIKPVYEAYEQNLHEMHEMDFSDIIRQATELCKKTCPLELEYIIVDEFQDISLDRYQFLQALRGKNKAVHLFCVGDDWQSIYRFSGSDMALFGHFEKYFGNSEFDYIETTYRFGEPMII
jgi:DNA helicase-4